ncbi:MAG: glucose-6-phosphate isomerase [Chloroflexota bacterium]|nr:MAG: glucose-6-phosphate isomerase [Chloroflexota bacterium]
MQKFQGPDLLLVETALADLEQRDVVGRMWRKDHTVWKPDPTEITNRLGWVDVIDAMRGQVPELVGFARQVREAGFRHVVLLGMGGSSLGPEVLRQTFGSAASFPELMVLDSTVPAWVLAVQESIDPARTLFLVSSKSGGTIEVMSLYKYFRSLVEQAVGRETFGQNFVAVTDPGTSLEKLAREQGFRRVFLNPHDIGGRYSVLSYFGLVPAALTGLDVATLLERAGAIHDACAASVPIRQNPGAWLGAAMGAFALSGRSKLTLIASSSIGSFGLWVEQLIAESTGKEGKGIIPIADEPLMDPQFYGDDRVFVYLRLEGDDNTSPDAAVEGIAESGQPVVRLDLPDRLDLGAEFFRWELATAVAGAVLGIQPFDQPNVQQSKDVTSAVLREYQQSGRFPEIAAPSSPRDLLLQSQAGDYLAIMAYLRPTPEVEAALTELRRAVMERFRVATTLGYGPRFLHSTGQLHKGGPGNGLYLQLVADRTQNIPIPGEQYTFGTLCDAQALGDLQALQAQGRRVARVRLGTDNASEIRRMARELA